MLYCGIVADARGDVLRGLQVAETACGITTQLTGEVLEVAKDMETRSYREPLGVVAAICPFSMISPKSDMYSSEVLIAALNPLSTLRFPRYDTLVVYSNRNHCGQHASSEALRT